MSAIDVLLAAARAGLDRVRPEDLASELAAGALIVTSARSSSEAATDTWTALW